VTAGRPAITPDTKVAALLEAYPELEEVLVGMAPPFAKLRNPVLRRTIARVTTLRRAAEVGGLVPRELVRRLREAAGLDPAGEAEAVEDGAAAPAGAVAERPGWTREAEVRWNLDADALLGGGREPLAEIGRRVSELEQGACGVLESSFVPAPLLEWLRSRGHDAVCVAEGQGYRTWIRVGAQA